MSKNMGENPVSSCCFASVDTDILICSECKERCSAVTTLNCCICKEAAFSDTWIYNAKHKEVMCDACAEAGITALQKLLTNQGEI